MADKKFDLGDYVEVKDRIKLFYELYAGGRLVTGEVRVEAGPDGKARVIVQGLAYRTVDDPFPGVGWSWMELPGTTSYTKGSELENTETSAWGRAIAALGILVDRSIATRNEIDNKAEAGARSEPNLRVGAADGPDPTTNGGLIGTAEKTDKRTGDYALRQSPDGSFLGFRLKGEGRSGWLVEAYGPLADALALIEADVIGKRVQVWGSFVPRNLSNGGKYQAFVLERISGPEFVLPAPGTEPETLPLGLTADEDAELDAAATAA